MFSVKWWHDRLYSDRPSPVQVALDEVRRYLTSDAHVLDVGAGTGERNTYDFKGQCAKITGVDFDDRVRDNPLLDEGAVMEGTHIPAPDQSMDIAFSIYVLEHVADPGAFAREISRVLRPNGVFISVTPNKRHYVPLIARMTPTAFHKWINARRGRDEDDTFPTTYLLNTARAQKSWFARHGLQPVNIRLVESEPMYLKFSLPTYLLGVLYERVVNATALFSPFRVNIVSTFRKDRGQPSSCQK